MKRSDKLRIEHALVTIGETLNFASVQLWNDFNSAIVAKDTATAYGDTAEAKRKLELAKRIKYRRAEIADIIDALENFDRLFHRTF